MTGVGGLERRSGRGLGGLNRGGMGSWVLGSYIRAWYGSI